MATASLTRKPIDPKKKGVNIVSRGKYPIGSQALDSLVNEGRSRAAAAGQPSSAYNGSHLGDKSTVLLGRANPMYKSAKITKKK